MSEGRLRPRPTSTRVPTRDRTIWWQKALASISKANRLLTPGPGRPVPPPGGRDGRPGAGASAVVSSVQRASMTRRGMGSSGVVPGTRRKRLGSRAPRAGRRPPQPWPAGRGAGTRPGQPSEQGIGHGGVHHEIAVAPGGAEWRASNPTGATGPPHHDGRAELAVAGADHGVRIETGGPGGGEVEVDHLAEGVDAAVGASRVGQGDRGAGDAGQRGAEGIGHGALTLLGPANPWNPEPS